MSKFIFCKSLHCKSVWDSSWKTLWTILYVYTCREVYSSGKNILLLSISINHKNPTTDLVELVMVDFDVILDMNWLYAFSASIDFRTRVVKFRIHNEPVIEWTSSSVMPMSRNISYLKARTLVSKGFIYHLEWVNDSSVTPSLQSIPIVRVFPKIFPDDLPRVLLERKIHFGIHIIPNTLPISIPPYRMELAKLKELKE